MTLYRATTCPKWELEAEIAGMERVQQNEREQTTVVLNRDNFYRHLADLRTIHRRRFE